MEIVKTILGCIGVLISLYILTRVFARAVLDELDGYLHRKFDKFKTKTDEETQE